MGYKEYEIQYPDDACSLDQDEECITIVTPDGAEKIRLHAYERFYEIPGLYEEVVYGKLKCDSPRMMCTLLKKELEKAQYDAKELRVLDFGAGNGIVGECLKKTIDCGRLVGLDILKQAKDAARRDRPNLYDEYYVMDLSELDPKKRDTLKKWNFNMLVSIGSLGYGDIPKQAFVNAFNTIADIGWISFNIRDRFLTKGDDSGYRDMIEMMMKDSLEMLHRRRYFHRLTMSGEPLYYEAIIGRKVKGIAP